MICGFHGCQHHVERRGICGDRACPANRGGVSSKPVTATGADPSPSPFDARPPARIREHWPGLATAMSVRDQLPSDYLAVLPSPIRDRDFPLPSDLVNQLSSADSAVHHLSSHAGAPDIDALASVMLRGEAVASSRIEGITASHRKVAETSLGLRTSPRAQRTHANLRTLQRVMEELTTSSTVTVDMLCNANLELLRETKFGPRGSIGTAGTMRQHPMWVGPHQSPRNADFIGPPCDHVPGLMDDLADFVSRADLPRLIQAGLAHAQFESIHPFIDGNGRVGRSLMQAVLRSRGVDVPVPISAALLANRDGYIAGLTAFQQYGDHITWLRTFLASVHAAATQAVGLADRIGQLTSDWRAADGVPRRRSHARHLLDFLVRYPVLDTATAARLLNVDTRQARRALDRLVDAGILRTTGGRSRIWRTQEVIELLDDFHDRLRFAARPYTQADADAGIPHPQGDLDATRPVE